MKKEAIITLPNPHLRQKSQRVHVVSDETRQLIKDMTDASIDWENSRPHEISAALAAVQIDRLERVVIVRADFEGCLSVKDFYGKVPRYSKIRVKAINIDGDEIRIKANGFLARVLQHEIDHCNGIVFVDHIRDDHQAFYRLNDEGELDPLDYERYVKDNADLWD